MRSKRYCFFFFNNTPTTEIYTLSLHDALPISIHGRLRAGRGQEPQGDKTGENRRCDHTVLHLSDSVTVPVAGHVLRMAGEFRVGLQVVQYLFKADDADDRNAELDRKSTRLNSS